MTKSKKTTKAAKSQRKEAREALMAVSPGLGIAQSGARAVARTAKKQHKKSGSSFWGILAGAAQIAGELAPVLAPLLLAKHAPSAANLATAQPAPSAAGVPLATTASCATCTGIYGFKPRFGKDGRLNGIRISGMDYLGSITTNSEVSGSVLEEVDLNPMSPQWSGTQAQRFASLFERFRPKRLAALVEPSCPATTPGQIIGFVDPDADDDFPYTGRQAIQVASSHTGADVSQVWGMNVAGYGWDDRTQDYYADPDGSDARLISPGTWRVLANTDMPASTVVGSMYVVWDFEFLLPQLEEITGSSYARFAATGVTAALPLGTGSWDDIKTEGALTGVLASTGPDGSVSHIYGLPPGYYFLEWDADATNTVPNVTFGTDNFNYIHQDDVNAFSASKGMARVFFQVTSRSDAPASGYLSMTLLGATPAATADFQIF